MIVAADRKQKCMRKSRARTVRDLCRRTDQISSILRAVSSSSFVSALTCSDERLPLRAFMLKQTREPDLALFMKLSNQPAAKSSADVPIRVLIPAFVTSELKTAFQIGFIVFIPFII